MDNYRVDLEVFKGPLDLLLYLVRKNEVEIFDIPITAITEQYVSYLRALELVDVDIAGEFLVMASTLMEIKSKMLLPREELVESAEDPRLELVKQLLEYKKFRDAAEHLQDLADDQRQRFMRVPVEKPAPGVDPASEPIRDVELWDLVSAFGRIARETIAASQNNIVYDDVPIQVRMDQILLKLDTDGEVCFSKLFEGLSGKVHVVGMFLAVLELVKTGRVSALQDSLFEEIVIRPADPPPDPGDPEPPAVGQGSEVAEPTQDQ